MTGMRYAICNETFEGWEFARVCAFLAEIGYQGVEVAPFTLADRITDVTPTRRAELRRQADNEGLKIIGLHWLLAKTTGLSVTSPDEQVRQTTADYLKELARACSDLGGDILVFGSPQQRRIPEGHSQEEAAAFALDTFRRVTPVLEELDVKLCLEPLAPTEADFLNTAEQAVALLRKLDSPCVRLHLDVKAMTSEAVSPADLLRRHHQDLYHFHANDANRRGPGFGDTDFLPIYGALAEIGYSGWVSVEVFDYSPDPETIARESLRYLRECESTLGRRT